MRIFKPLFVLIVLVTLVSLSLPVQAQGGPKPVGLRPDAPPYALHGRFWVGMKELAAKTDLRQTKVALWYPALNPKGLEEAIAYPTAVGSIMMRAIQWAAPDTSAGPYPLVVYAHGVTSQHFASTYLTEHLASHGFVVMAIDYTDSGEPATADLPLALYTRPKDVSWQIDFASRMNEAGGYLPGMVDTQHIAVVGWSQGGYTALMTGGARLDFSGPTSFCVQYPDLILPKEIRSLQPRRDFCDQAKQIAALAGLNAPPEGLWPSWADSRVTAIVPMAPSAFFFGAESVKGVTIPTLALVGSKDQAILSNLPLYQPYVYDNLGSVTKSLAVFEGADHTIFGNDCDTNRDWAGAGYFWACSEPVWDMARAHDLINHFTTAFLLDVLKGDKEAHKALLLDAVKFAGISYKTTMK